MENEIRAVSAGMRRAVQTAGRQVQGRLREQARGLADWRDGGRALGNTWRLKVYPDGGAARRTFKPAALVSSRMPIIVDAFERGVTIRGKRGQFLAIPTGFNAVGGRRGRGKARVSTAQMTAPGNGAFVIRSKKNRDVSLWCLPVRQAQSRGARGRVRSRLFVAGATEVGTGNRKGRAAWLNSIVKKGFLPMFILLREVKLRRRLDIEGARREAAGFLARAMEAELSGLPRVIGEAR